MRRRADRSRFRAPSVRRWLGARELPTDPLEQRWICRRASRHRVGARGIMRAKVAVGPAIVAVATAALTGCSSSGTGRTNSSETIPTGRTTVAPSPIAGSTSSDGYVAVSLAATSALRTALRGAYVAARPGVRLGEVDGPRHGTLYYAFDPATRTYWAIAWFDPSSRAQPQTAAKFQFGMGGAVFKRTASGAWRATVHLRANLPCPDEVPAPVLRAWRIKAGSCTM